MPLNNKFSNLCSDVRFESMDDTESNNGTNSDTNSGFPKSESPKTKLNPYFIELNENWSENSRS